MAMYAFIDNNMVVAVQELSKEQCREAAQKYSLVVDITEQIPQPAVGWVLVGNKVIPNGAAPSSQQMYEQSVARSIVVGKRIKDAAAARIGGKNLMLGLTGPEVAALVSQLISVGFLLEGGALNTARGAIMQMQASYPNYNDEFQRVINEITEYVGP